MGFSECVRERERELLGVGLGCVERGREKEKEGERERQGEGVQMGERDRDRWKRDRKIHRRIERERERFSDDSQPNQGRWSMLSQLLMAFLGYEAWQICVAAHDGSLFLCLGPVGCLSVRACMQVPHT